MSASLCGISFNRDSLASLYQFRKNVGTVGQVCLVASGIGLLGAIVCKIQGAVASFFTQGNFTTLGALVVSSPYFYVPLALVMACAVGAVVVDRVCSNLIYQMERK